MKKQLAIAVLILNLVAVTFFSAHAAEKKILLKTPLVMPTALPVVGTTVPQFAEELKAASGGSVQVKIYEPGKLIPPFEVLSAVSKGSVNAGITISAYWQGKLPAASLFTAVPFGPEADEFLAWLYHGNGLKLYQEMYDNGGYNVKVMPFGIVPPETAGWFTKEINSPEDLKGLKVRFMGYGGKVLQKLGVAVSLLPAGEIFQALEKGVIDGAEFSNPSIDKVLGFYKIAKYNYFPGWHQQASVFELLINKDEWNAMSDSQRAIIEMAAKSNVTRCIAESEAIQGKIIRANVEERGVKTMYWSDEMLDLFKKSWDEVVVELSNESPEFKRIWDDLSAFRADYAYWKKLGFLPRENKKAISRNRS